MVPSSKVPRSGSARQVKLHVLLTQDEDAIYSAVALNLPGVGSCGDTEEEALENLREAAQGALERYAESGDTIPWKDSSSEAIPADAKQQWIIVHA